MIKHHSIAKPGEFQVREYRESDWPTVCQIYDLAKPHEVMASGFKGSPLPLQKDQRQIDSFRRQNVFVYETSKGVLGFAGFEDNYIGWLFVSPEYFRHGIARSLLKHVLTEMSGHPWLYAMKNHFAAVDLYLSEGFSVVEEIQTVHGFKLRLTKESK